MQSFIIFGLSIICLMQQLQIMSLSKSANYLADELVKIWTSLKDLVQENVDNASLTHEIKDLILSWANDSDQNSRTKGD